MELSKLKQLDEVAYARALENIKKEEGDKYVKKAIKNDYTIGSCFIYSDSNEGIKYWAKVLTTKKKK
jgi:hypothetical protein